MNAFRFYSWFWLALAPLVLAGLWWRFRPRSRPAAVFSSVTDLKDLPVTTAQRLRRALPFLYGLGLCLVIAGLARPQAGKAESRISGQGIAIELVIDVSGSMEAIDFQLAGKDVSRLEAVKHVIEEFVLGSRRSGLSGRTDDLIGLVAFGGFADSKCPLTLDHGALVDIVRGLEIPRPIRDSQGRVINAQALQEELATAIGDGVAVGVDRLRGARAKSKVLILLTDGDSNAGVVDPREAARIAMESGIKFIQSASAGTARFRFRKKTSLATACSCRRGSASMKTCCVRWPTPGRGGISTRPIPRGWRRSIPRSTSSKNRSSRKPSTRNIRNFTPGWPGPGWR